MRFMIPYRLPSIYKKEEGKHLHRIFVFLNTTDDMIRAVAAEAAACQKIEMLKLWFELGITENEVNRYIAIFTDMFGRGRNVEVAFESNVPSLVIKQWSLYAHIEAVKRRALLN